MTKFNAVHFLLTTRVNGLHCARYVILSEVSEIGAYSRRVFKRRREIDVWFVLFNAVVSRNVTREKC